MENNIKKGLKPEQRQELKKYAVFALMFLVFGGSMWLIFKPDKNDKINILSRIILKQPFEN